MAGECSLRPPNSLFEYIRLMTLQITTPMTDRWRCFKNGSLNMMDQMMESSIIPLTDNVLLIRKGDGRGIDAR